MMLSLTRKQPKKRANKGFGVIEIVITAAIMTAVFEAFAVYYTNLIHVTSRTTQFIQSTYLLEEGVEVVKYMRDDDWDNTIATMATNTPYYLSFSGLTWVSTTSQSLIDNVYTRTVTLDDVYRDANDDIATSGPSLVYDPGTKKLTVTVSWFSNATSTRSLYAYIGKIF